MLLCRGAQATSGDGWFQTQMTVFSLPGGDGSRGNPPGATLLGHFYSRGASPPATLAPRAQGEEEACFVIQVRYSGPKLGQKGRKMVRKWSKSVQNGLQMVKNDPQRPKLIQNGPKLFKMGPKSTKIGQNGSKRDPNPPKSVQ